MLDHSFRIKTFAYRAEDLSHHSEAARAFVAEILALAHQHAGTFEEVMEKYFLKGFSAKRLAHFFFSAAPEFHLNAALRVPGCYALLHVRTDDPDESSGVLFIRYGFQLQFSHASLTEL